MTTHFGAPAPRARRAAGVWWHQALAATPAMAGMFFPAAVLAGFLGCGMAVAHAAASVGEQALVDLDVRYQKAVEQNDAATMGQILADDFVLVEGYVKRSTKSDLINDARGGKTHYKIQRDTDRTVLVSGDTAVVTAKLWAKGVEDGVAVDYKLWFSDVYVRTPKGWRYFFGQASLPLPAEPRK